MDGPAGEAALRRVESVAAGGRGGVVPPGNPRTPHRLAHAPFRPDCARARGAGGRGGGSGGAREIEGAILETFRAQTGGRVEARGCDRDGGSEADTCRREGNAEGGFDDR